jgi:hypothetical protein
MVGGGIASLLAGLLALGLAGCAAGPRPQWLPAAAWWAEDAARGIPRDPLELRRDDAGSRLDRLADWAEGDRILDERRPPEPLRSRALRWPALAAALAGGDLAARPDGLLAVMATGPARADLRLLAEAENRDRRRGDAVMAALLDLDDREADRWASALREARRELDRAPATGVKAGSPPAP